MSCPAMGELLKAKPVGVRSDIMLVRIAKLSDLDDLHELVVGFRDHLQRTHPDDASLRKNLGRLVESGDAEFFLTFDEEGSPAGYIQQRYRYSIWLSALEACLEDLFVTPSRRRQGVANGLVQFAIQRASEIGCRSMKLDTNELNHAAISLYKGLDSHRGRQGMQVPVSSRWRRCLNPLPDGRRRCHARNRGPLSSIPGIWP